LTRTRELLIALTAMGVGGAFALRPGPTGGPWEGLVGVHGVPRPRTWDAVASANAPDLPGDGVAFVVLDDGTVVVEEDVPDGSLVPLADALDERLQPPYRAAAIRHERDVWSAVAERVAIVALPGIDEDEVELTVVDGERTLTLDGERTIRPLHALDALAEQHGDVVVHAERVDGDLFAADIFPL
jgi:hypothetical protein